VGVEKVAAEDVLFRVVRAAVAQFSLVREVPLSGGGQDGLWALAEEAN
jgi:hypothetical protein